MRSAIVRGVFSSGALHSGFEALQKHRNGRPHGVALPETHATANRGSVARAVGDAVGSPEYRRPLFSSDVAALPAADARTDDGRAVVRSLGDADDVEAHRAPVGRPRACADYRPLDGVPVRRAVGPADDREPLWEPDGAPLPRADARPLDEPDVDPVDGEPVGRAVVRALVVPVARAVAGAHGDSVFRADVDAVNLRAV